MNKTAALQAPRLTGANIPGVNAPAGTAIYRGTDSLEACRIQQNPMPGFLDSQPGLLPIYRDGNIVFEEAGNTKLRNNMFNSCRLVEEVTNASAIIDPVAPSDLVSSNTDSAEASQFRAVEPEPKSSGRSIPILGSFGLGLLVGMCALGTIVASRRKRA